ncbi:beta-N-acetylglucosaminidase domain-containing protein [Streptomyces sp. NPDC054841]
MTFASISLYAKPTWRMRAAHAVALVLAMLVPAPPGRAVAAEGDEEGPADACAEPAAVSAGAPDPALPTPTPAPAPASAPAPTPRSVKRLPGTVRIPAAVTLVAGAATDGPALTVVRDVLRSAGVRTIRQIDGRTDPGPGLAVVVGGAKENAATAAVLDALGVQGAETMAAEGYVMAARDDRIVLAGADAAGTYYAAQTLRELLRANRAATLAGVEIRDWPGMRRRGIVEGFHGRPWSHEQRLAGLDWMGRHKMNLYVYTPKDDPYLRAEWRKPYPADELARLRALVERAQAQHVEFGYVLSPGLSVCCSDPAESRALTAKFASLRDIGVRTFVVAFDDIDHREWNCGADRAAFGTGPAASAAAQAHLVNAVQRELITTHSGAAPLEMVPTEYRGTAGTEYAERLARELDPSVVVRWTGAEVIAPHITRAEVADARKVLGHPVLLGDNYPVNDYVPGRLLLGPYTGRESSLAAPGRPGAAVGLVANPMPQVRASLLSLFTVADYAWNDIAYDPERSWAAAISELAGHDPRTVCALRAFAGLSHSSRIDPRPAPELSARLDAFWREWTAGRNAGRAADRSAGRTAGRTVGRSGPVARLHRALSEIENAPAVLRARLADPVLLAETKPWLDATEAWGRAARTALDMLTAQRAGRGADAWAARQSLSALVTKASSYTWTGLEPDRSHPVELDPVLGEFVERAIAENNRWLVEDPDILYLRMRGTTRATASGYSVHEFET